MQAIQSATVGSNAEVFKDIIDLHTQPGDKIADVTYGKGVFWNAIDDGRVNLTATDLDPSKSPTGESVDCRSLPYSESEFDGLVLDPPYSSGFYKDTNAKASGDNEYSAFRESYTSDIVEWGDDIHPEAAKRRKRHARVLSVYFKAGDEAERVLDDDGIFIVKTQDEVSDNKNYLTHVELINYYESIGFNTKDLFVVVRPNDATTPNDNQHVALKNHSYFLVFDKAGGSLRG